LHCFAGWLSKTEGLQVENVMVFIGILLAVVGVVMLLKPGLIWRVTESWKSTDASEPSSMYVLSLRVGGVMFLLVGLGNVIVYFLG
jgi:hypothetical protein